MSRGGASGPVEPVFLDGPAGRLFAVHYRPPAAADAGADLVYVPPFAEEMNRARRMVALQARALAASGIGALVLDLYGTGESQGDFADARWPIWQNDILAAADWLQRRGRRPLGLWGLRLGGLLAATAAAAARGRFARLLLWQPVTDGQSLLVQFLRIRIAAAMSGGDRESTDDLRAQLAGGRALEVAGYELAPELAGAIEAARIETCGLGGGVRVDWLDLGAEAAQPLAPGRQRVIEAWRRAGVAVAAATVAGEPFWSLQETTLAPALLAATVRAFAA